MIARTGDQPAPAAIRALHRWCLLAMAGVGAVPAQADAPIEDYVITVDADAPLALRGSMLLQAGDTTVWPARHGDAGGFSNVRCADGRLAGTLQSGWQIPQGCQQIEWDVRIVDLDVAPTDATVPQSGHDPRHGFWLIAEASALLRRSDQSAAVGVRICASGDCRYSTPLVLPSDHQPPLYAAIGGRPRLVAQHDAMTIRVHGKQPELPGIDEFPHILAETMARWGCEFGIPPGHHKAYDWVWLAPAPDQPPGFYASAGFGTFVSQLVIPEHAEDKTPARFRSIIWTGAAHEAFHSVSGRLAAEWPAWVNESLASYFALESARQRLDAADFAWIDRQYALYPDVPPLLEAQRRYDAGDSSQSQHFYVVGVHFWRTVAGFLDRDGTGQAGLAGLIRQSAGFAHIDLTDPVALIRSIERRGSGELPPEARCLLDAGLCPDSPKGHAE